jgi:hypothetical protein
MKVPVPESDSRVPSGIATAEGIDIVRAVGNPTGGSIHAEWLLARVDGERGQRWAA